MKSFNPVYLMIIVIMWSSHLMACEFDNQCGPGFKCLGGGIGWCVIGHGEHNSRQEKRDNAFEAGKGDACKSSIDCGPNYHCLKEKDQHVGTCR